jgi:hypothetical protein
MGILALHRTRPAKDLDTPSGTIKWMLISRLAAVPALITALILLTGCPATDPPVQENGGADSPVAKIRPDLGPPQEITEADFQFDTVLHAVDDLGMDPTGQQRIDEALDEARASHTLIVFPPGKYRIAAGRMRESTHQWGGEVEHFGIKGLGEKPKDVQFVLDEQPPHYGGRWISDTGGVGTMYKNFALQQREDPYTSADLVISKEDLLLIEEVEWAGTTPPDNGGADDRHGNNAHIHVSVTEVDGVGEINRIYMREGAMMPGYPDGMAGLRVMPGHEGTFYWTDLWIEQRGSSSFRFTPDIGRVILDGGFFKNNANTNMRAGAGDHPEGPSIMRNATVIVDGVMNEYQPDGQTLTVTEAIHVDDSNEGWTGLIIENIDIYFIEAPRHRGVIARPSFGEHGSFTVRDVNIRNDTDTPTLNIEEVSIPDDDTARFENLQVTGQGSGPLRADPEAQAEIVNSCVASNFAIENFDIVDEVDRTGCQDPATNRNN